MSQSPRQTTIVDVARYLGLAKGTVSRALNNYPDVSPATRSRVVEAAEKLGYRPSSIARRLKTKRVESIGIVMPMADNLIADPFLSEFLDGISHALDQQGQDLLVSTAPSVEATVHVYERLIAERKVDGIIVTRTRTNDPRIQFLREQGFPFVTHGQCGVLGGFAYFDIDNELAFVEAVAHIAALGHRRIGFIGGPSEFNFSRLRLLGYRTGMIKAGLEVDESLIIERPLGEEHGRTGAQELMAQPLPPTAILCTSDALAVGAMRAVRELGLRVGSDVSVIGYDGIPVGAYVEPPLTTFSQSMRNAGAKVAAMVMAVIDGAAPDSLSEMGHAVIVKRESDGPPARQPAELAAIVNRQTRESGQTAT
ncbi:MAG: substrate-binding domain-containing protein [Pseudomonadota bacterium]